jgi:hypothetical protein
MTTGFRNSANVDFDDLFDPYVQGTKPAATGFQTSDGVDLRERYAPIAFGSKGPNVGYQTNAGVDVSNLWAAAGTAVYFPSALLAQSISASGLARTATLTIAVRTNGNVVVNANGTSLESGSGTYPYGANSSPYDFRISGNINGERNAGPASGTLTGKGGVNFTAAAAPGNSAAFDTGWQSSADDANNFLNFTCNSPSNAGAAYLTGNMSIQVRRKSDGVVVSTLSATFQVSSDSQS